MPTVLAVGRTFAQTHPSPRSLSLQRLWYGLDMNVTITVEATGLKNQENAEEQQAYVNMIQAQVQRLSRLVDKGVPCFTVVELQEDEAQVKLLGLMDTEEMGTTESVPLRFLGCKLITDDDNLANALRVESSAARSDQLGAGFPNLVTATRDAIRALESKRLVVEEIHVWGGQVRAMTSEHYGRRDSGWFAF